MSKKERDQELLTDAMLEMREAYTISTQDSTEEAKFGREVRLWGRQPRWVYSVLVVLALSFMLGGLVVNQRRGNVEVGSVDNVGTTAVQGDDTIPASLPAAPPLIAEPPIPAEAVPAPPEFAPIPTPPIDTTSPIPIGA